MALTITTEVRPDWTVRLAAAGATGTVTWYRDISGRATVVGTGSTVIDRYAPLNTPLVYVAVDSADTAVAPALTVASTHPVLSSSYYGTVMQVTVVRQRPQGWDAQSVWHPVIDLTDGPLVTIFEANHRAGEVVFDAPDYNTRVALLNLLRRGDPLILRATCPYAVDDMTILPTHWEDPLIVDEGPQDGPRRIVVSYQSVSDLPAAWSPPADWTYQAVLDMWDTYQDLIDNYATYEDLLAAIPS